MWTNTIRENRAAAVSRPVSKSSLIQIVCREFPIGESLEQSVHVADPSILVVQIVRMLPDVDGQERLRTSSQGRVRIAGVDGFLGTASPTQPSPATAEIFKRQLRQFLLARNPAAKG